MAALQSLVWLSFQRKSCYDITKQYKICYLGKFQRFGSMAAKLWNIQV